MEALLFDPDPAAYLPHRDPFLFIDRITLLDPGVSAAAVIQVSAGCRAFPPVILIEAMAQLGGIAAGQHEGEGGILAAVDRALLPQEVRAGERVTVEVRIVKGFGKLFLLEGKAAVGGETVASAELTLAIGSIG